MQIPLDNFMGLRSGVRDPAGHLFHVELTSAIKIKGENLSLDSSLVVVKRKPRRRLVPELDFAPREVDRARVEPAGRARLESPNVKAQFSKFRAQNGARIRHAPAWPAVLAYVQESA